MKRLKVLFITAWYPTKENPVGCVFVREHAKAVRLYDDVVVLHCAGVDPNLKGLWRMERETDERLTEGIPTYRVWHRRSPIPKTSYLIHLWSVFRAFPRVIDQAFRPDIIHAHVHIAGAPAGLMGKLYHIPVVVTEHSSGFPGKLLRRQDLREAWLAFKWASVVMPVSRSLQQAIEAYGIKARFRVVPNVVDTSLFHPNPPTQPKGQLKRILFVGLLDHSHRKGVPYLLRALTQLHQQRDDWHLDIVGDGSARVEYEQLAMALGIFDEVTFHGLKPRAEVAKYMRQCDFFVLPSLFETFGVVLVEALATGKPVIATDIGGPNEIVTEQVGLLVPPRDAAALAAAIDYMLDHYEEYPPGTLAEYVQQRFSYEVVGQIFNRVYHEVLNRSCNATID